MICQEKRKDVSKGLEMYLEHEGKIRGYETSTQKYNNNKADNILIALRILLSLLPLPMQNIVVKKKILFFHMTVWCI